MKTIIHIIQFEYKMQIVHKYKRKKRKKKRDVMPNDWRGIDNF